MQLSAMHDRKLEAIGNISLPYIVYYLAIFPAHKFLAILTTEELALMITQHLTCLILWNTKARMCKQLLNSALFKNELPITNVQPSESTMKKVERRRRRQMLWSKSAGRTRYSTWKKQNFIRRIVKFYCL
jgi:hypothetical protein